MKLLSLSLVLIFCISVAPLSMAQGPAQGGRMGQAVATNADKAKLAKLEKEYNTAKAKLAKSPKNKKIVAEFATIGSLYGHESMLSPVLPSRIKYRQALRIYREVLKVDPKNPVAKQDSEQIISIYKSMGRPIPKD